MNAKIVILFFAAFACQVHARPGIFYSILKPINPKDFIGIPQEAASSFWGDSYGYGSQGQNGGIDQLFEISAENPEEFPEQLQQQLEQIAEMIFDSARGQAQSEQETALQQGEEGVGEVEDEVSEARNTVDEADSEQVEPPMPQLLPATLDD